MTNEQWDLIDQLIDLGLEWLKERGEAEDHMDKCREASQALDAIRKTTEAAVAGDKP